MKLSFKIGHSTQDVDVPETSILGILESRYQPATKSRDEIQYALQHPIGSPPLGDIVHPGEKIAIISSDITRPMPTWAVMPAILDELYAAGIKSDDITLVFALGSHRRHTEAERKRLAGERAYAEIRCIDSDPDDCIHMGITPAGTPVDITRIVAQADRRICLGNIEYHYFAGYSGGAKAIMPGVSTREAIQFNHCMMTDERACVGNLETNPVRQDIEQAAALCGVDFILNVVLDERKQIARAFAGHVIDAHRAGCAFLDGLYRINVSKRADIVIVSQGGAPKDLNLYQTQKALDNAKHAVRDGGVIILIGSCEEGLGEETFEKWLLSAHSPEDLVKRIGVDFQLGGHKAAAIAMVLAHASIFLVSHLPSSLVSNIFMTPFATVLEAYDAAVAKLGSNATVLAMPYGGSTLPYVVQ